MNFRLSVLAAGLAISVPAFAQTAQTMLPWAYPVNAPGQPAPPPAADDGSAKHVPNSAAAFTMAQIRDLFNPPDWHPDGHPAMPESVAHGRKPDVRACGYCHLPNGFGRPENSSLAGLNAAYIVQQMADYKAGLRKSAEARMGPQTAMVAVGKAANDAEVASAAAYFASVKTTVWVRVVEADTVPKTIPVGNMMTPVEPKSMEPIGARIIETPENVDQTNLRDAGSGFVAYVPTGSIKKGEALATTGGAGKTVACGVCHGADLKGLATIPSIAGRSPSYLARQLYDFQSGARKGAWSPLMKEAVAKLTPEDMLNLAAYAASRKP